MDEISVVVGFQRLQNVFGQLGRGSSVVKQVEVLGFPFPVGGLFPRIALGFLQRMLDFRIGLQCDGPLPFRNSVINAIQSVVRPAGKFCRVGRVRLDTARVLKQIKGRRILAATQMQICGFEEQSDIVGIEAKACRVVIGCPVEIADADFKLRRCNLRGDDARHCGRAGICGGFGFKFGQQLGVYGAVSDGGAGRFIAIRRTQSIWRRNWEIGGPVFLMFRLWTPAARRRARL